MLKCNHTFDHVISQGIPILINSISIFLELDPIWTMPCWTPPLFPADHQRILFAAEVYRSTKTQMAGGSLEGGDLAIQKIPLQIHGYTI